MDYDVPNKWYYVLDIRLIKYLEYFVKHGTYMIDSCAIWVPFLDYLQDDLEIYNNINERYDDMRILHVTIVRMTHTML